MSAPTLETRRLTLRPWRDADIPHWVAMHADTRVMEFFPSRMTRDIADDFAHPRLEEDDRLKRHVLYRLLARDYGAMVK